MENVLLELYQAGCRVNSEFYLREIDLKLRTGECVAIMGKNASGKSTLFSLLMGLFPIGSGEILLEGKKVRLAAPQDALEQGILMLGQNQPMFGNLKVYENIYFGQELTKGKMLDNGRMCREAGEILKRLAIPVNPTAPMAELGHARRQLVSLARAVCTGARLILMDEPSTHLDIADKRTLWDTVKAMKGEGKSFLYITHDPAETLAVADRVAFMEDGVLTQAEPVEGYTEETLAAKAYGIRPGALYERERVEPGPEAARVESPQVAFSLRRGQVTALLGDSETAQGLLARMGGLAPFGGTITVNGVKIEPTPLSAIENGVSLAIDDAAEEEINDAREFLEGGSGSGFRGRTLYKMRRVGSGLSSTFGSWLGMKRTGEYVTGGNRRRELMERALGRRASLYLLMDPSAGMDVPARMRMYARFGRICGEGAAILFATGNLSEAIGLADRILVVRDGKLLADRPNDGDRQAVESLLK